MRKIKELWSNKWIKFGVVTLLYVLVFVVWSQNLWMLLGIPILYDIYVSKYIYNRTWQRHKDLKKRNSIYKNTMDWVEALLFAVIIVSLIRVYIFALYTIPTPSMEKSLLVGDYLYVSKVAYGPVMPNTPISFPMVHNTMPLTKSTKSYSEAWQRDYKRLRGFVNVKRGDAVVFNFPAGDTVALERQAESYYDIRNAYARSFGEKEGRERLYRDYTIVARPVDKRENYVKRCVALPGDTLQIIGGELMVNGQFVEAAAGEQKTYLIKTTSRLNPKALQQMGIYSSDVMYDSNSQVYQMPLTKENSEKMERMKNVVKTMKVVEKAGEGYQDVYPKDNRGWNEDYYGPIWIPQKGATVELTLENLPLYENVIRNYEKNSLRVQDGVIYINDKATSYYTFHMDYYFMMGDNRDQSADSRFWGFVPEDHIVGKARFIWLSLSPEKKFPSNIRWSRLFSKVR